MQQTTLITGASSGIGLELARQFGSRRHPLVLVARRGEPMRALAAELVPRYGIPVEVIEQDLAQAGAAERLFAEVERRSLRIEILVNNAGYACHGDFLDLELDRQSDMVALNVVTLTESCHLFGRRMLERGGGRILNVASTAAFLPGPHMAAYYATKAYVLSLSEALNEEYRARGLTVTALCPGPTRSGFQERAGMQGSRLLKLSMMEAAPVAAVGYTATMAGRPLAIPGPLNQAMVWGLRLAPRSLVTRLSALMARKES